MALGIPTSLIFLGGKSILQTLGSENHTGVLGGLCNLLSRANDSLVYSDFKRIQKRWKINLNGHLHVAYIKACQTSVEQIKREFKTNNHLGFSSLDWFSDMPSEKKILTQLLHDTCEKIIQVFKHPDNIENLFDQQFQISGGDQFFTNLLDLMLENGKKSKPIEPFLRISQKRVYHDKQKVLLLVVVEKLRISYLLTKQFYV